MLSLFDRRPAAKVRIVRKDHVRRKLGLPPGIMTPWSEVISANEAGAVPWLAGMSAASLESDVTVVRRERPNPLFRAAPSRVFEGTRINRQYWGVREQHPLKLYEFRDVVIASNGNDLSIFRGTTVDERVLGIVPGMKSLQAETLATLETVAICDDYFMPGNPCHVIVDRMSRAMIFRTLGVAEEDISFVFDTSRFGPFARDKVCPKARGLPAATAMRAKRLLVLSTTFQPAQGHPFWYGDAEVMAAILSPLLAGLPASEGRKVYLARTDATRRPLLNEPELIERLAADGFEPVVMGSRSPHEQLELCRSASVIVAPHGAAVMNAVAAEPGTRVVELFNPEVGSAVYAIVSHLVGHDYRPLFGTPADEDGVKDAWRIDIEAVRAAALG